MTEKILVVDDEDSILQLVDYNLRQAGYAVSLAADGAGALATFEAEAPDLVILDVMLPDIDGFDVCRRIRRTSSVPILFLTARDDETDKIVGLELGADDYLTKPFSPAELVARVRAILRRLGERHPPEAADGVLQAGPLRIDPRRYEVYLGGEAVSLTPREFDLLLCLTRNAGLVMSRDTLLDRVWGPDFDGDHRVVDVHIKHLRDKLAAAPGGDSLIVTIRGVGYKLQG